jgi:membrane fusion protein, multidrug efflux system
MNPPSGVTILPGMTATVTVTYRQPGLRANSIFVPISAISQQDNGAQVAWVIGPDQIVRPRRVRMGVAKDGEIEVVKGLKPGDRIGWNGLSA